MGFSHDDEPVLRLVRLGQRPVMEPLHVPTFLLRLSAALVGRPAEGVERQGEEGGEHQKTDEPSHGDSPLPACAARSHRRTWYRFGPRLRGRADRRGKAPPFASAASAFAVRLSLCCLPYCPPWLE